MAKDKTIPFRLNHHCRLADCTGNAGDVVQVSPERAKYLVDRGGGKILGETPESESATPARPETATAPEPPSNAATRPSGSRAGK